MFLFVIINNFTLGVALSLFFFFFFFFLTNTTTQSQVDDPLVIQQLKPTKKGAMGDFAEGEDDLEADVDNAASGGQKTGWFIMLL